MRRILLLHHWSSCVAEQFHSDANLEAVDQPTPNNSKHLQRTTEEPPSWQTIDGLICNRQMSTEPGKLIGTKLAFQMNPASICGTMTAAFVLDAMQKSTLSDDENKQFKQYKCNGRIDSAQRKHLDYFLRGRIVRRLECGRTNLEVAEELTIPRFSLQSDSQRTLIWRVPGNHYHQENTIERHRYGGAGGLAFGEELFLVLELTCMFRVLR
ncbi:uncharacterized protein TNCV_3709161 [Trichonephila clavipes]|nr:uncharacterized protein TNCV_3709161 [Trichonephila clavipes]